MVYILGLPFKFRALQFKVLNLRDSRVLKDDAVQPRSIHNCISKRGYIFLPELKEVQGQILYLKALLKLFYVVFVKFHK